MKNHFRIVIVILISFLLNSCSTEERKYNIDTDSVYLIFRGNKKEKQSVLVGKYNLKYKDISHVGILLYKKGWSVYHLYESHNESDINIENINSFFKNVDREIILKIDNIDLSCVYERINELHKEKIKFDSSFDLTTDNRMYCSEFIVDIFKHCNLETDRFINEKKLPPLHARILLKDTLRYYPVDSFIVNEKGNIVYEKNNSNLADN